MDACGGVSAPTAPSSPPHGSHSEDYVVPGARLRRPTAGGEGGRETSVSVALSGTTSSSGASRPTDSVHSSRGRSQTFSMVTSSSGDSGEERKFKDDKSKRVMVVREIVE